MRDDSNLTFNADYADWYDAVNQHKPYKQEIEFLDRLFRSRRIGFDSKILDLGCGTGTHAIGLHSRNYRVFGLDRSPEMIRVARSKNSKIPFFTSALEDFPENEFDACYSMGHVVNCLPHFEALTHFMNGIYRSLKEGGFYYFEVWNPLSLIERPPTPLTRTFETPDYKIIRHALPTCRFLEQEFSIEYEIQICDRNGKIINNFNILSDFNLFTPRELVYFLEKSGFHQVEMAPAVSEPPPLSPSTRFLSFHGRK